jgi:hypothetical protein
MFNPIKHAMPGLRTKQAEYCRNDNFVAALGRRLSRGPKHYVVLRENTPEILADLTTPQAVVS